MTQVESQSLLDASQINLTDAVDENMTELDSQNDLGLLEDVCGSSKLPVPEQSPVVEVLSVTAEADPVEPSGKPEDGKEIASQTEKPEDGKKENASQSCGTKRSRGEMLPTPPPGPSLSSLLQNTVSAAHLDLQKQAGTYSQGSASKLVEPPAKKAKEQADLQAAKQPKKMGRPKKAKEEC
eukprot:7363454-Karenia_brevis.AAC.1